MAVGKQKKKKKKKKKCAPSVNEIFKGAPLVSHILCWAFKFEVHLEIAFQMLALHRIKLICRLYFFSFCRDIHFQSFDYFSAFKYKINFGKSYIGSEKNCIEYTCRVFFFFFFFFFFVQYIHIYMHMYTI